MSPWILQALYLIDRLICHASTLMFILLANKVEPFTFSSYEHNFGIFDHRRYKPDSVLIITCLLTSIFDWQLCLLKFRLMIPIFRVD